jgi:hypothetical protein
VKKLNALAKLEISANILKPSFRSPWSSKFDISRCTFLLLSFIKECSKTDCDVGITWSPLP